MGSKQPTNTDWKAKAVARGRLILNARTDKNYTQEELAKKLNVKHSSIQQWESGKIKDIGALNSYNLSVLLEIDFKDLIIEGERVLSLPPDQDMLEKIYEALERGLEAGDCKLNPADKSLITSTLSDVYHKSHTIADLKKAVAKLAKRLSDQ